MKSSLKMKFLKFLYLWVLGFLSLDAHARTLPEFSIWMKNEMRYVNPGRTSSFLSPSLSSVQPIEETKGIARSLEKKKILIDNDEYVATQILFDPSSSRQTSIFQILIDFRCFIKSSPAKKAEETTADNHESSSSSSSILKLQAPIPDIPITPKVQKTEPPPIPDQGPIPEVLKAKTPPKNPDSPPISKVHKAAPLSTNNDQLEMIATPSESDRVISAI